jgi:hypothetical protein
MLYRLKRHPFAIKAHFDFSVVLTYAFPENLLAPLLPPGLAIDSFQGYGFLAVAMVQTRNLRPSGLPSFLGTDFFLSGYRIFVKYHTPEGKRYRGLYILRSDTDSRFMKLAGNILTHYKYNSISLTLQQNADTLEIQTAATQKEFNTHIRIITGNKQQALPAGSVFADWTAARRFAGPMPFTFDYEKETNSMLLVEGQRENWTPEPVGVEIAQIGFLNTPPFNQHPAILSNAFITRNIAYRWKKGRRAKL